MGAVPGLTEDSTVIAKLSQQFWEQLAKRQKYRCSCNGALRVAPGPRKAIAGGRYTLDFAVNVAVDKYALPLERQVRIMKRAGLVCDSQTLWDQLDALAVHLEPSDLALREYIIGADETWWRLMQKKANKKWYAWGLTTHDACWYKLADSQLRQARLGGSRRVRRHRALRRLQGVRDRRERGSVDQAGALLGARSPEVRRSRAELSRSMR
ncbi:MAG: transposase [Nannocystaceae bacterium]|nr:transposase [Nannocystaceae bacterium]